MELEAIRRRQRPRIRQNDELHEHDDGSDRLKINAGKASRRLGVGSLELLLRKRSAPLEKKNGNWLVGANGEIHPSVHLRCLRPFRVFITNPPGRAEVPPGTTASIITLGLLWEGLNLMRLIHDR